MIVGDRVKLHAPSPILHLTADTGTVARPDPEYHDLGYWIVRLDAPAAYHHGDETVMLLDVREHEDNLTVVD